MITIKNLHYICPGNHILKGIHTTIPKGKITTIIGPNGCGKSTMVKSIAGLLKHQAGEITFENKNIRSYKKKDLAQKMAFLMQFSAPIAGLSVYDVVTYGRMPYKEPFKSLKTEDYHRIDWAMKTTDIEGFKDRDIGTLSGGEQQRVWLAMCLAQNPDMLVLDEPTNHLDIKYQYDLLNLIKSLNENHGITVLLVLHDINQAARYSHKIIVMKDGNIAVQGRPEKCISSEMIKKVYEVESAVTYEDYAHIRVI